MELIRGPHNIRPRHHGCVASVGNFDGMHLGHQAVLRQRLIARGREALADIEERLARNTRFTAELIAGHGAGLFVLDNSGPLEHTVERLLCCLDHGHSACA